MKKEEIEKMEKELAVLKKELTKYQKLFESDGHVDTEEQKQLNTMQATITQAETELAKKKKDNAGNDSDDTQSLDDLLGAMNVHIASIKNFVDEWNIKLNQNKLT